MKTDEFLGNDGFLTKELLRLALSSSDIGVWKVDLRSRAVELNSSAREILGIPIGRPLDYAGFFELLHPEDRDAAREQLGRALDTDGDGQCSLEFRMAAAEGAPRWLHARGAVLFDPEPVRRPTQFIGTMRDITDRKTAEAVQLSIVEHQQDLLNEINHRVKNSLQLVSSLLRLQARRITDIEPRRKLEDAVARISTIAHIHERLYRDRDFQQINFGAFLSELCADLQGSAPHCPIAIDAPDFMVSTDRAIPLALIVNEMVTNAFKYAYPEAGGPVAVRFRRQGAREITIEVEDAGVGLPPGFSASGASTLGMTLISSLVGQLSGRIEIRARDRGTCFAIVVPDPSDNRG